MPAVFSEKHSGYQLGLGDVRDLFPLQLEGESDSEGGKLLAPYISNQSLSVVLRRTKG